MEMVSISKADYEEFLRFKGGAINTPKPTNAPAGGFRWYKEGSNPFDPQKPNIAAQHELAAYDPKMALDLAERVNSPLVSTLREMAKAEHLRRGGF